MKKDILYVDAALFQLVIDSLGLRTEEQKGFVKVHLGPKGRLMYVARTKQVGRIDISGFTVDTKEFAHVKDLGGEAFGAVAQQVNFEKTDGRTAESLVATFRALCEHGMALPDAEPKPKGAKAQGASPATKAAGWSNDPIARLTRVLEAGHTPGERLIAEARAHAQKNGLPDPMPPVVDEEVETETDELTDEELEAATAPEETGHLRAAQA